jgi:membrane-bound serine protease (ClpP class)
MRGRHLLLAASCVLAGAWLADAAAPGRVAVMLQIEGAIGPAAADYLERSLDKAKERKAALVVLRMDTPGGLDTSMREMIRSILASPIPIVSYVSPSGARAASAGTYLLYASHVAAMAPGTNLGAATPVSIGGLPLDDRDSDKDREKKDDDAKSKTPRGRGVMDTKIINDAAAYMRGLADLRGRNADWAEKAVREGVSLSAREARENNVIDLLATSLEDLFAQLHGRTVIVGGKDVTFDTEGIATLPLEPDWRTRLLGAITNPNVAVILMMLGIYGLLFELVHPGAIYPGTVGAISMLVALYALAALPVNLAGLGLMVLGVALMVAEAMTPSLGALGIGGAIAFMLGATMLIDTDLPEFEISWSVIGAAAAVTLGFALAVVRLAWKARERKVASGREEMLGARGKVIDWAGTAGHVFAHGERWNAVAASPLRPGQDVRVSGIDGLILRVEADKSD